jgi:hypothetical protein
MRSQEAQTCYRVLSAGIAPERVEARDGTGLMRAFTTASDISRKSGYVPIQMQQVRDEWQVAVSKIRAPRGSESVVFTHGPGTGGASPGRLHHRKSIFWEKFYLRV